MSAFATLLGPVLVLWTGALVLYIVDRFLKPQDRGIAEAVVLVLGIGFLLGSHAQLDLPIPIGQFPAGAGEPGPFLVAGDVSWLLALILLGSALAASLASLGAPTDRRAGRLAALGAALLFLFAGDWATLALAWALVDVCLLYALGQGSERAATLAWAGFLSLGGAVLLGVAALLWQQAEGSAWVDRSGALPAAAVAATHFPPRVAGLLVLAGLLRLMPFPLPAWQHAGEDGPSGRHPVARLVAFVIPTLLGTYLWTCLAQWDVMAQSGGGAGERVGLALSLWAVLGLLAASVRSWGAQDPDALIACAGMVGNACVLLGAGLGLSATWQLAVGVNVLLGVPALFVSWVQCPYLEVTNPRSYWRIVPTGLALLSLAGLPLTVGFPARVALYWTVFAKEKWFLLLLLMAAEALAWAALLRVVFGVEPAHPVPPLEEGETQRAGNQRLHRSMQLDWQREVGYAAGAALAGGIVVLGFAPQWIRVDSPLWGVGRWFGVPTLSIWAALLLAVVGAIVLYRRQDAILALAEEWWPLIRRVLDVDWAYRAIASGLQQVSALIWGGSRVVEGAGYMAWVVLACLVILLFVVWRWGGAR